MYHMKKALIRHLRYGFRKIERLLRQGEEISGLPLNRYPHDFLIPRVWQLRATLTAHGAAYVALSELLDAPLLTCDSGIVSASGHHATVEVV